MIIHNVIQGSQEWLDLRKNYFSASDASAMLGYSKYKTRTQLLNEKAHGVELKVTPQMQAIFDKGHKAEELRRELLEIETCCDWPASVISDEIDGLPLLASLDGNENGDFKVIFEHKIYNKALADYIEKEWDLPDSHWPQVEQQLLLSGASSCLFITSNGTEEKEVKIDYISKPYRVKKLIAGWHQFKKDMDNHKLVEKSEKLQAVDTKGLPALTAQVSGTEIITNADAMLMQVKLLSEEETARELVTDQDFADKDKFNKDIAKTRKSLKTLLDDVKQGFTSIAQFEKTTLEIDSVLQKMHAHGTKQVKTEKEARKHSIICDAIKDIQAHIFTLKNNHLIFITFEFEAVTKGLKTLDSVKSKCADHLAELKIKADAECKRIDDAISALEPVIKDHLFLFNDYDNLVITFNDDVLASARQRISDYETEKAKREEVAKPALDDLVESTANAAQVESMTAKDCVDPACDQGAAPDVGRALSAAVSAICCDDKSDYLAALKDIVIALAGKDALSLLEKNPSAAFHKYN